ncbi:hypothetical protein J4Q44_G00037100, partial [Coregonus suidteri]
NTLSPHTPNTQTPNTHTPNTHSSKTPNTHTHKTTPRNVNTHSPPPISPPHTALALLTAEPYCQPSHHQPGLKPVKVDGSSPLTAPPPTEHPGANQKTDARPSAP